MALTIDDENGKTIQNPEATTNQNPQQTTVQSNENPPKKFSINLILKQLVLIWNNITVEPLMVCWLVPTCFLIVLAENLTLEKVSRMPIFNSFIYLSIFNMI